MESDGERSEVLDKWVYSNGNLFTPPVFNIDFKEFLESEKDSRDQLIKATINLKEKNK